MHNEINQILYNIMAVIFGILFACVVYYFLNAKKIDTLLGDVSSNTEQSTPSLSLLKTSQEEGGLNPNTQQDLLKAADSQENASVKAVDNLIDNLPNIDDNVNSDNILDNVTLEDVVDNNKINNDENKKPQAVPKNMLSDDDVATNNVKNKSGDPEDTLDNFIANFSEEEKTTSQEKESVQEAQIPKPNKELSNDLENEQKFSILDDSKNENNVREPKNSINLKEPKKVSDISSNDLLTETIQQDKKAIDIDNLPNQSDDLFDTNQVQGNMAVDDFDTSDNLPNDSNNEEVSFDDEIFKDEILATVDDTNEKDEINDLIGKELSLPEDLFKISEFSSAQDKDIGLIPETKGNIENMAIIDGETDIDDPVIINDDAIIADTVMIDDVDAVMGKTEDIKIVTNSQKPKPSSVVSQNNPLNNPIATALSEQNFTCQFEHFINSVDMNEVFVLEMIPENSSEKPIVMKIKKDMQLYQYLNISLEKIDNYPSEFSVLRHFCKKLIVKKSVSETY